MSVEVLRLGTRGSPLAMWQAEYVRDRLTESHDGLTVEIVEVKSEGDIDLKTPLVNMGEVGIFTKTIELQLLEGKIDLAVHSLKDVPAKIADGTVMGAYPPREDPRDAWFHREGKTLREMAPGEKVATGSLRRRCQILHHRGDLEMVGLRGNLNRRWEKFQEGQFDAMLLAAAGVIRLGWQSRVTAHFEPEELLPAVAQGTLGLQVMSDGPIRELLAPLNDPESEARARAERALLEGVAGGCVVPLAGHAVLREGRLWLRARLGRVDGSELLEAEAEGDPDEPEAVGMAVAEDLLSRGGGALVREAKEAARNA